MPPPDFRDNDPLFRLRHALAGVALALLLSVPIAAFVARVVGDAFDGDYPLRAALYGGAVAYCIVGAGVLFAKVARHETRPLSLRRLLLWLASVWLWPALWLAARGRPPRTAPGAGGNDDPGGPRR